MTWLVGCEGELRFDDQGTGTEPPEFDTVADGEEAVVTGVLEVAQADNFFIEDEPATWREYTLLVGELRVRLDSASLIDPSLRTGAVIRARGLRRGSALEILPTLGDEALKVLSEPILQEHLAPAEGVAAAYAPRKVALILFNFRNNATQPYTPAAARGALYTDATSVTALFREQSFDQMGFIGKVNQGGDVYGWFTIDADNTGCDQGRWSDMARDKATAAGFQATGYDHIMYVFPQATGCRWAGLGHINGPITWIHATYGIDLFLNVAAHELGHNVGWHHASTYRCTGASGAAVSISDTCSATEYGDPFDIMGYASRSRYRHTNIFNKGRRGWLSASNMLTVTSSGDYTIAPMESASGQVQLLRIAGGRDGNGNQLYYYVEFRQPVGMDTFAPTSPVVNGVSIRLAPELNQVSQTKLIDATPETGSFDDAPLLSGRTVTDST
ncbi:MAG: hypothetical protein HY698_06875, partial [Deltaproteobacteria bacterium]|nr:hypothetical protein [Deltaproteobacteria bacterium]